MSYVFNLGAKVKCKTTGYKGIIIGRTEWLYGCRRYTVQSQEMKDGKPVDAMSFDEDGLQLLKDVKEIHEVRKTGGPRPDAARRADVRRS